MIDEQELESRIRRAYADERLAVPLSEIAEPRRWWRRPTVIAIATAVAAVSVGVTTLVQPGPGPDLAGAEPPGFEAACLAQWREVAGSPSPLPERLLDSRDNGWIARIYGNDVGIMDCVRAPDGQVTSVVERGDLNEGQYRPHITVDADAGRHLIGRMPLGYVDLTATTAGGERLPSTTSGYFIVWGTPAQLAGAELVATSPTGELYSRVPADLRGDFFSGTALERCTAFADRQIRANADWGLSGAPPMVAQYKAEPGRIIALGTDRVYFFCFEHLETAMAPQVLPADNGASALPVTTHRSELSYLVAGVAPVGTTRVELEVSGKQVRAELHGRVFFAALKPDEAYQSVTAYLPDGHELTLTQNAGGVMATASPR